MNTSRAYAKKKHIQIAITCMAYRERLRLLKNLDSVLLIRYEDMARAEIDWAEKIYRFIGQPMDASLVNWLNQHRYAQKKSEKSTVKWRKQLSFEQVLRIQAICGDVMAKLNYNLVQSETEILDESFDTIGPNVLTFDKTWFTLVWIVQLEQLWTTLPCIELQDQNMNHLKW